MRIGHFDDHRFSGRVLREYLDCDSACRVAPYFLTGCFTGYAFMSAQSTSTDVGRFSSSGCSFMYFTAILADWSNVTPCGGSNRLCAGVFDTKSRKCPLLLWSGANHAESHCTTTCGTLEECEPVFSIS